MVAQDTFDQNPHSRPSALPVRPINRDVGLEATQQFMGDELEGVITHHIDGALGWEPLNRPIEPITLDLAA